jgi:gamma-glutamyltranspeptidase
VAQAPARALDLFESGSSASDGEPANLAPPRKRPRKSPVPKIVPKPSEALATKGTLEQFFFLCLS